MKKGKDSYDVFEVFKERSFMDGASFGKKLAYWLKNVYWYHFKIPTFALILVIITAAALIHDVTGTKRNDLDFILGGAVYADTEQMSALSDYLADAISAPAGDKASVGRQMLCTEAVSGITSQKIDYDEYAAASIDKISVSFADDEILLFLLDKKYTDWYNEQGAFEPLSEFGIESENTCFVDISDSEIIKKLGIKSKDGIYASIKMINASRRKDERIMKKYENAAAALRALMK